VKRQASVRGARAGEKTAARLGGGGPATSGVEGVHSPAELELRVSQPP